MSKESRSGAPEPKSPRPPGRPAFRTELSVLGLGVAVLGSAYVARAEFDSEKYLVYPVGRITLRPQLEIAETYDSNLFYAETNRVEDLNTSIRPGLLAVYGERSENFFSLRYTLDGSLYLDRDDLNNFGHLIAHRSRFQLSRVLLQATDNFALTDTLLGGTFSYIQKRIGLVSLNDNWRADYEISPKALVGVKALFDYADYDEKDLTQYHLYDYLSYAGGMRFGYVPSDKIVLFPEVTVGQSILNSNRSTIPDAPDLTTVGFSFGAEGDFTPKLTGLISAGYEIRDYANDASIPDGWIAEAQLRWQFRPKTSFSLGYRHWIQVSREAVAYAYNSDRITVSATQEIGTQGRWSVTASGYYQFDSYDTGDREDSIAGLSFRGNYRWLAWLTVSGGYDFYTFSDNVASIPDYDIHRVSIRLVAGY